MIHESEIMDHALVVFDHPSLCLAPMIVSFTPAGPGVPRGGMFDMYLAPGFAAIMAANPRPVAKSKVMWRVFRLRPCRIGGDVDRWRAETRPSAIPGRR
jgi:hypothetical protein